MKFISVKYNYKNDMFSFPFFLKILLLLLQIKKFLHKNVGKIGWMLKNDKVYYISKTVKIFCNSIIEQDT